MPRQSKTISDSFSGIFRRIKRLGTLYIEKARLKTTEKVTILLSSIAFTAVVTVVGFIFLIFVSVGIGHLLASSIAPHLAYLIIAAFYLVLLVAVFALRRVLFINPISRFVSRLMVDEPEEGTPQPRSQEVANYYPESEEEDNESTEDSELAKSLARLIKEQDSRSIEDFSEEGGEE